MKTEKFIYFAYGANLDKNGMNIRCPGNKPLCRAVLKNYRLVFRNVADIEEAINHCVHGALYEITKEHLQPLDRFEGYPRLYIRKTVTVIREDGTQVKAIVYQITSRHQYSSPYQGYLNIILSGCLQWQFPEQQIQQIINRANNSNFGEYNEN
ncbi:gamma-glutamylcyclotransferase [bacterium]|nr:gamma-glutamylcyclotransferase [bacterium]